MPRRPWRLRVEDILEAAGRIRSYVTGLDEASFRIDQRTADAVLRNFEIIGEAARHVPSEVRERYPGIPWIDMADMRNVLSHEYFGVDYGLVWRTAAEDLPAIERALSALLKDDSGRS